VQQDLKDQQDHKGLKVLRVVVQQEHKVLRDLKEHKVHLDLQVVQQTKYYIKTVVITYQVLLT
jgi:hypothetical protein